ncbi:MAG: flagellar export chaperone FlgN [Treponema sp.]|nr:flagellar export chaperone FlgN [Treponema sp.]MCI5666706.1 flagellar export chaperone FlgN [Spirochaetia bacterium]MDD7768518.1 flagellar export chaperone FlgN [Treponema sp.]MDY3131274.1 flagellar export chaperone FlgN [Treponema sp.]
MELTNEELNERVALLKKFRALLEQQRNKFQEYLTVLEKQQDSISKEDPEALLAHTELEQQVVKNIANLQKVIVPMTRMYKAANQNMPNSDQESITKIQNDLNDLQNKVLNQNKINRDLLRVHIDSIRQQIQNFKNPYKTNRSVYSQKQPVAQLVEVDA